MMMNPDLTAPASLNPFSNPSSSNLNNLPDNSFIRSVSPNSTQVASVRNTLTSPNKSNNSNNKSMYSVDTLEYQDIAHTGGSIGSNLNSISIDTGGNNLNQDAEGLLSGDPVLRSDTINSNQILRDPNASYYSLAYYRCFFDVSTNQILSRLLRSLLPFKKFYTEDDNQPDYYGPFWICTTLIFVLAATGNFASYLLFRANKANGTETGDANAKKEEVWNLNFSKITIAASVFYCYITVIPILFYYLISRAGVSGKSMMEISSLFGYSLFPYLFACFLSIPPVSWLRWLSISFAYCFSILFLLKNLWTETNAKLVPIMIGLIAATAGLALLTKIYFFDF
jgi:hypothetical protein